MTTIPDWPFCSLTPLHVAIYPEYSTRPDQDATNGMRRSPGLTSGTFRLKLIDVTVQDEAGFRTLMAFGGSASTDRRRSRPAGSLQVQRQQLLQDLLVRAARVPAVGRRPEGRG